MKQPRADVALVASSFLPRFGGVEEHVLNVARSLSAQGNRVVVWAADRGDVGTPSDVDGVVVRYLPCPLPARSVRGVGRFLAALPRATARWRAAWLRDRPRVLHVQCFGPNGAWSLALAALTRRPLVVSTHGETFADADGVFERSALLPWSLRWALRRASATTACSAFAARDLARFGATADVVDVVPNGIDLDEPASPTPPQLPDRFVLGIGRLVHNKGFDLLVEAFSRLESPDLALVLAGDGPERSVLESLARQRGVAGRVFFTGRLNRPDVVATMAAATALVVPSRAEAFGIAVLEGWRAGIPVIATDRGGVPEFVEDGRTGLLVNPEDVNALATRLAAVLADSALAARLGTAGRQEVRRFTWDGAATRYRALYARAGAC